MPAKKTPLEKLNDILGKNSSVQFTTLADDNKQSAVKEFVSTGILTMDVVFGGGWPVGRVIEIFGHEAAGKSMLAAKACVQYQRLGYGTVYLDNEYAVDEEFFNALGVDSSKLYYGSADDIDSVFSALEAFCENKVELFGSNVPLLFVWDSVASTTNKDEKAKNWEDKSYATTPIYLSAAFRRVKHMFSEYSVTLLATNQIRSNVGVMFGDKYTTFGGWPMKFYSSLRVNLDEESVEKIGEKGERKRIIGMNIRAQCVKNRMTTPYRECLLPLKFIEAYIDEAESTLVMLKELGLVITNPGGNYKLDLPGVGDIGFKKDDVPELITEFRPQLYDYLVYGWKRVPAKNNVDEVESA